jgi:hypothetical protein
MLIIKVKPTKVFEFEVTPDGKVALIYPPLEPDDNGRVVMTIEQAEAFSWSMHFQAKNAQELLDK